VREFDRRPWGSYEVLEEAPTFKVKRIEVLPRKRLSYQKHSQRAEHWFVVAGTAKVTLDGNDISVHTGESIDIPVGSAHRVENPGDEDLIFIEVQRGSYLGEDDIVRLEDDFGRT
jgi:mannose-6-phosphate isomerase